MDKYIRIYNNKRKKKKSKKEKKEKKEMITDEQKELVYKDKELLKLQFNHKMEMEDKEFEASKEDKAWRSCCFNLHPESSKFFGKFTISIIIIGVCSYQLIVNVNNCAAQIAYSSMLSLIVGSWMKI